MNTDLDHIDVLNKIKQYRQKYFKERYNNDEEFKNKLKETAKKFYIVNRDKILEQKRLKYKKNI